MVGSKEPDNIALEPSTLGIRTRRGSAQSLAGSRKKKSDQIKSPGRPNSIRAAANVGGRLGNVIEPFVAVGHTRRAARGGSEHPVLRGDVSLANHGDSSVRDSIEAI